MPKANTLSPERGRPEGVTKWGFKGETDEGTCETFPRVSPFERRGHVNDLDIIFDMFNIGLRKKGVNPGLIDSPSEKKIVSSRTKEKKIV